MHHYIRRVVSVKWKNVDRSFLFWWFNNVGDRYWSTEKVCRCREPTSCLETGWPWSTFFLREFFFLRVMLRGHVFNHVGIGNRQPALETGLPWSSFSREFFFVAPCYLETCSKLARKWVSDVPLGSGMIMVVIFLCENFFFAACYLETCSKTGWNPRKRRKWTAGFSFLHCRTKRTINICETWFCFTRIHASFVFVLKGGKPIHRLLK